MPHGDRMESTVIEKTINNINNEAVCVSHYTQLYILMLTWIITCDTQ